MRVVETQIFKFSELDESSQQNARDWWLQHFEFETDYIFDDFQEISDILGIDFSIRRGSKSTLAIYFSGFCTQGDGASFEGSYSYKKGAPKAVARYAPEDVALKRIATELQKIQKKVFYSFTSKITTCGRYQNSSAMGFENNAILGNLEDIEGDIEEALRDFANWMYGKLENEYTYQTSNDIVDENIEANEYEFYKNGERV